MKVKLMRLDKNLKEVVEEFDSESSSFLAKDIDVPKSSIIFGNFVNDSENFLGTTLLEKTLVSLDLPGADCDWRHGCRFYTVRHGIYARVSFPDDLEEAVQNTITNCFATGVAAALLVLGVGALTPGGMAAAAGPAFEAFKEAFALCIDDAGILEILSYEVKYESHKV